MRIDQSNATLCARCLSNTDSGMQDTTRRVLIDNQHESVLYYSRPERGNWLWWKPETNICIVIDLAVENYLTSERHQGLHISCFNVVQHGLKHITNLLPYQSGFCGCHVVTCVCASSNKYAGHLYGTLFS